MMRIGLDLHPMTALMQGSRTYIHCLTQALIRRGGENAYTLYLPDVSTAPKDAYAGTNITLGRIAPSRIKRLLSFGHLLRRDHIDLFHCQYLAPPMLPCPYVLSLHDIIHESNPEFYPGGLRRLMSRLYPRSARKAAAVLTISEYSRQEIIKRYQIPGNRVRVALLAADESFKPATDQAQALRTARRYGINGKYILFVGRIEPRKNIPGLIEAFGMLTADGATEHTLVVAGMMDDLYRKFHAETTARFGGRVVFTGKVEQEDLPSLYAGADLFVYPSFAEGFGLPPLEAMACGTPVITSNTTSLPEVMGDAGVLVDPHDTAALAHAMRRVLADADLRRGLRTRGLEQSQKFSWDKTAAVTAGIYEAVLNPRAR
jgi:glycosyltransferase involved in cell wall biosynthesis